MLYPAQRTIAAWFLLLAGCDSGTTYKAGVDATSAPDCVGGETRCEGSSFQTCQGGVFVTDHVCETVCSQAGCSACFPGVNTCESGNVVACNADGSLGEVVETCEGGTECTLGTCERVCTADGVDLIYVVDSTYRLLSFDPRKLELAQDPFVLIGQLACSPQLGNVPGWNAAEVTPFSMAIDRNADAWVLYTSGEMFKVSTQDASCAATSYVARQAGMLLFGMGFVTDQAGGNTETLYLGGGDPDASSANRQLASVDANLVTTIIGPMPTVSENSAELTGTGAAELFGFYPGVTNAFVQGIDKATGAGTGQVFPVPGGLGAAVRAWAFAQWGGRFYIFVTTQVGDQLNSTVQIIDKTTGAHTVALSNLEYVIVGAGVSTCAPVVLE